MCVAKKTKTGSYICETTGKPISVFNTFGSYCEKLCGYEAQIFATTRATQMLEQMGPIFDQLKDRE